MGAAAVLRKATSKAARHARIDPPKRVRRARVICPRCRRAYSRRAWRSLPFLCVWDWFPDEPPLELRNCPCHDTLAIKLSPAEARTWREVARSRRGVE